VRLSADIGRDITNMLNETYVQGDRIDAAIMHTRTHRRALFCDICWTHAAKEACSFDHDIRLRRPFHPDSLGALLKEYLT
jgi:hypothetical protein